MGSTCQNNIHMNGRTQGFPAELKASHCLLPIVHPGTMCSPGHSRGVKENVIHQTRLPSFIAPWSLFWCSHAHCRYFWQWTVVSMDTLNGLWLHRPVYITNCDALFWHLSIRTNMNFFNNLSYRSSSVGLDHAVQPLVPTRINEHLPPMTQSPVHWFSFLGPLMIGTDHCKPGTPHKSSSFGDALTQLSSHISHPSTGAMITR